MVTELKVFQQNEWSRAASRERPREVALHKTTRTANTVLTTRPPTAAADTRAGHSPQT